jgi:hypothetical protein
LFPNKNKNIFSTWLLVDEELYQKSAAAGTHFTKLKNIYLLQ